MKQRNTPFSLLYLCLAIAMVPLAILMPDWHPRSQPTVSQARSDASSLSGAETAPPTSWPDYSINGPGFVTPAMPDGDLIAYGYRLITETFTAIGPEVSDPARRFAGNNLACQNCHLDGGTNRTGLPLVGVVRSYPKFSNRARRVISLAERVNECMTRSMNGRSLPDTSREMAAYLAYLRFIGEPQASEAAPATAATSPGDARRGAETYDRVCAQCHRPDGLGQRWGSAADGRGYRFPPLWGPDSFNDGAGMDNYERAVGFIWHNMPRGDDPARPQLDLQEAWDVTAFLQTKPRPHFEAIR